jgi:hypothetical protein
MAAVLGNHVLLHSRAWAGDLLEFRLRYLGPGPQKGRRVSRDGRWQLAFSSDGQSLLAVTHGQGSRRHLLRPHRLGQQPVESLGRSKLLLVGSGDHVLSRSVGPFVLDEIGPGGRLRPSTGFEPLLRKLGELPGCAVSPTRRWMACTHERFGAEVSFQQRGEASARSLLPFRDPAEEEPLNVVEALTWWRERYLLTRETMEYRIEDRLVLREPRTGRQRALWRRPRHAVLECGPTAGAAGQMAAGGQGEVRMWRDPNDARPTVFTGLPDRCEALAFRPDGTLLALMKAVHGGPVVLALRSGHRPARVLELDVPDADIQPVAFSPGRRYLATTTQDTAILLWRLW